MSDGLCANGNARGIRTELGEAVDDGRYPGLAIDENGVEEGDDQQLLNQAQEQAVEVVFAEELRRSPCEVQSGQNVEEEGGFLHDRGNPCVCRLLNLLKCSAHIDRV